MDIQKARRGKGPRFGARKYAAVPSESEAGKEYTVVKVRVKGSRNYKYVCTCPDHVFRQHACKHIKAMQDAESHEVKISIQGGAPCAKK